MRIISCRLENFASYKELDFMFDGQGLTLIHGPTGAGKSTLCDAIPWILFGRTAKDGAADEVRSWNCDAPTRGTLVLEDEDGAFSVTRIRGKNANDLYFDTGADSYAHQRGKDIPDTQRMINRLLGVDANLYLLAAYYHEFSSAAQFFTATAKNRRLLCEQLVDLSLAKRVTEALKDERSDYQTAVQNCEREITRAKDQAQHLANLQEEAYEKSLTFEEDKEKALAGLAEEISRQSLILIESSPVLLEKRRRLQNKINALSAETCTECGNPLTSQEMGELRLELLKVKQSQLDNTHRENQIETLNKEFDKLEARTNDYDDWIRRRKDGILQLHKTIEEFSDKLVENQQKLSDIETLTDVISAYRSASIADTISMLEGETNKLLSEHFDAEIKVMFEVEAADKLDVLIFKDGNQCVFTQLSKGQRQLLKLCFAASVMRTVANRHGLSLNVAFFDECFDGLSEHLKVKAFGLLKTLELEYQNLFVVEHSTELKALFTQQYEVALINGSSILND